VLVLKEILPAPMLKLNLLISNIHVRLFEERIGRQYNMQGMIQTPVVVPSHPPGKNNNKVDEKSWKQMHQQNVWLFFAV